MKKISLIILTLMLFVTAVKSQDADKKLKYKDIVNNPYDIPNFEVMLIPIWTDYLIAYNMTGGWGAGAKLSVLKKLHLDFKYLSTYSKNFINLNNPGTWISGDPFNYNYVHRDNSSVRVDQNLKLIKIMETGLSFTFNDKVKTVKEPVNLHRSQTAYGNVIVVNQTVSYVDIEVRKRVSFRLGFDLSTDMMSLDNIKKDNDYCFTDKNGTKFYYNGVTYADVDYEALTDKPYSYADRTIPDYEQENDPDADDRSGWTFNYYIKGFSAGIYKEVIRNQIIDIENYGKRSKQGIGTVYADLLFADVTVDEILFFGSNPDAVRYGDEMGTQIEKFDLSGKGEDKIETNPFGFRVGFDTRGISLSKILPYERQDEVTTLFNLGLTGELGIRPGIKGKGFYMLLGFYLTINGHIL